MPHAFKIQSATNGPSVAMTAVQRAPEGRVVTVERKFILTDDNVRARAVRLIKALKVGWVVRITERNRTREQNAKMWAMLTDLSLAKPEGRKCTPDDWKCLVMHACGHDVQFMIGLDEKPFPVGFKSSALTIPQMGQLIEWMYAYGAEHGVQWSEPEPDKIAA